MRARTKGVRAAVGLAATALLTAGITLAGAGPASAADRDARICSDGPGSNSAYLRDNLTEKRPIMLLTRTGFNGSTDHFYITESHTQSNGAQWYYGKGYGYGSMAAWGYVYYAWVSTSDGRCLT